MSQAEKTKKAVRSISNLKRWGVWTGLVLLTAAAVTVFTLCACKSSGRW